jgi:hypothetical protein
MPARHLNIFQEDVKMEDELNTFAGTDEGGAIDPDAAGVAPVTKKSRSKKAKNGEATEKAPRVKKEKAPKEPKPRRDNIGHVIGLNKIDAVRRFLQIAIAKKAKSVGKEEAIIRYDNEIAAARARLEELLAEAGSDVQKLIELGEDPNRVISSFIVVKEQEFAAWLEANGYKVGRTALKNISCDLPMSFLDELPMALHEVLSTRHTKSDFRLQAVCRATNFLEGVKSGDIVQMGAKWVSAEEFAAAKTAAPVETISAE